MRWITVLLMVAAVVVIGASCTSAAEGRTETPEILDIEWLAQSIAGREVAEGVVSTVRFGSDGQAVGDAGCNRFGGSYILDGDRLEIGPLAATKRMCPEEIMSQEDRFLEVLGSPLRVELTPDGFLLLYAEDGGEPTRLASLPEEDPLE